MKECEQIRELFPWYVKGSLSAEESQAVAGHIAVCDACRDDLVLTLRLSVEIDGAFHSIPGASSAMWNRIAKETQGRSLGHLDVGSFFLGFSMGARYNKGAVPIRGDLRVMGRKIRLFGADKGGTNE